MVQGANLTTAFDLVWSLLVDYEKFGAPRKREAGVYETHRQEYRQNSSHGLGLREPDRIGGSPTPK